MSLKFNRPQSLAIYKSVAAQVLLERSFVLGRLDTKAEMLEIFSLVNRIVSELYDGDTQVSTSLLGLCGAVHVLIDDPSMSSEDAINEVVSQVNMFETHIGKIIQEWDK